MEWRNGMHHYVFIKFKSGYLSEDKINKIKQAFAEIKADIEGVREIVIEQNCIERDTNMDLMIRLLLTDEAQLKGYLKHPSHLAIAADMDPYVQNRVSFDCI
jgi:hypothetical protein